MQQVLEAEHPRKNGYGVYCKKEQDAGKQESDGHKPQDGAQGAGKEPK